MKLRCLTYFCLALIMLAGCERESATGANVDPVLATVGESAIHRSQMDVMLGRLTPDARDQADTQLEARLLQGMVRTRALAMSAEQQLSDDERRQLEARVDTYRDELLVQTYIRKNIAPQPVTAEMVKQYYLDHQAEYTLPGKVSFEVISTTMNTLDDAVLEQVLEALSEAKTIDDWKPYAVRLEQKKLPLAYRSATMVPASINNELRAQIARLQTGEVSDVVYADTIYIAKVTKREPDSVKPMHEVSVDIRKKLAPQKLKQALTQHIDQAMQDLNVEYTK